MAQDPERKKAADKAWREANQAYRKAYREANKERKAAAGKVWYEANKERKAAAGKVWYEANKERKKQTNKAWHDANKELKCTLNRRYAYGISTDEQRALFASQKGVCAICNKNLDFVKAHLDHCHKTGRVRGFLCPVCNTLLGYLEKHFLGDDNTAKRARVFAYLLGIKLESEAA